MGKNRLRLLGVTSVVLAGTAAWADIPPRPPRPPASQPATEPATKPAPVPEEKSPGRAGGVILGLGATVVLLGGGMFLVRRRQV